jgi:hypothetical protein
MSKAQSISLAFPIVMNYPKLNRPDIYDGGDPTFKVDGIAVDNDKNRAKLAQMQELFDEYLEGIPKKKGKPLEEQAFFYDLEDGTLEIRFKNKVYTRKSDGELFSMPIAVVDAQGKPLGSIAYDAGIREEGDSTPIEHAKGIPSIGSGTKAIVNFEARPFKVGNKVGLSLRIKAIKIKELVEYTGASFDDDDEDDDFADVSSRSATDDEADDFT